MKRKRRTEAGRLSAHGRLSAYGLRLLLAAALMLTLAACGQTEQNAQESAAAETAGAAATENAAETEHAAATGSAADPQSAEAAGTQEAEAETESPGETETQAGPEDMPEEFMVTDADGSFEGIVVDAAMNSLVIDTGDGIWYSFSYPESGVEMELSDGLLLGMSVLVESEAGMASRIQDGPTQPAADRDVLAFAADILFACRYKSMDALANLAGFPLSVRLEDGDSLARDAEEFLALPQEEIFSEERVAAVLSADLYELTELDGGKFVLGSEEGIPNITFQRDDGRDSGFAVTGIN